MTLAVFEKVAAVLEFRFAVSADARAVAQGDDVMVGAASKKWKHQQCGQESSFHIQQRG